MSQESMSWMISTSKDLMAEFSKPSISTPLLNQRRLVFLFVLRNVLRSGYTRLILRSLLDGLKNRGIRLVRDTLECLGTVIGLNHAAMSQWAYDRITSPSHLQLFSTLLNPSLPVQAAMAILRLCAIPRMSYLSRTLKPAIVTKAGAYFDSKVFDTASTKLRLPSNLTPGARSSLTLPIRLGGFGLRSVVRTSYASYWSGLVQAAPDILSSPSSIPPPPPPSASSPPPTIPLMKALSQCYQSFTSRGLPSGAKQMSKVLIPLSPLGFWNFYGDAPPPAGSGAQRREMPIPIPRTGAVLPRRRSATPPRRDALGH